MRLPRLSFALAAGALVVAIACAVPLARAATGARRADVVRPVVVAAGPIADPSDRAGDGFRRVTFSPDGDGRSDLVTINVRAAEGERLVLQLRTPGVLRYADVGEDDSVGEVSTLTWDGLAPDGHPRAPASYILRVCSEAPHLCAATRLLVHLRIASIYTPHAAAVSVGQRLRVDVATDRAGPYTLDLVSAADSFGSGFGARQVARAGWVDYRVPRVPGGGLWLLRFRSGRVVTFFPLVVHQPGIRLDRPPTGAPLVVYPYITWRAYNRLDENRDGVIDSWYAHPRDPVVPLYGPFEVDRREGVLQGREANPGGERAFARWQQAHHLKAEAVTDVELVRLPLSALQRYPALVFEGHTEYYERSTYEKLLRYRAAGGRLYFLQGNAFYGEARVGRSSVVRLSYRYRTRARSDFEMAANGFRSCCWPRSLRPVYHLAPRVVEQLPWLVAGAGLKGGDAFGVALGEVDGIDPRLSPRATVRVASAVVPAFALVGYPRPFGWIGTHRFRYALSSRHPQRIDIAYAATGRGEVFSWGDTDFLESIDSPAGGLSGRERRALDRVALNVWRRFAR